MEDVFWDLADEVLLSDLLSRFNYHLCIQLDPTIRKTLSTSQIELSWYHNRRSLEIYTVNLRGAKLLAENWQEIANRVQQLISDHFFLVVAQGYPGNFQMILMEQVR